MIFWVRNIHKISIDAIEYFRHWEFRFPKICEKLCSLYVPKTISSYVLKQFHFRYSILIRPSHSSNVRICLILFKFTIIISTVITASSARAVKALPKFYFMSQAICGKYWQKWLWLYEIHLSLPTYTFDSRKQFEWIEEHNFSGKLNLWNFSLARTVTCITLLVGTFSSTKFCRQTVAKKCLCFNLPGTLGVGTFFSFRLSLVLCWLCFPAQQFIKNGVENQITCEV